VGKRFLYILFLSVGFSGLSQPVQTRTQLSGTQFVILPKSEVDLQAEDFSGKFSNLKGRVSLSLDSNKVNGFDLVIDVNSLELEIPGMTKHAKSSDFFDVTSFPTITFFGDSVTNSSDSYTVHGTMTSKGTSKAMSIPFKISEVKGETFTINATFKIIRSEFQIGAADAVSDEVTINTKLLAKKSK
jgi:polyisoprenoid-binding protein YceI